MTIGHSFNFKNFQRSFILRNPTWARDFAGAWIFYTVIPGIPGITPRFERIARFAPIIGILIGLIQGGSWLLLTQINWPKEAIALLSVGLNIWITGGLHLDGLMDTADGLAAGEDRCIEAMQDSRVGASGVQALTVILLIQLAALIKLDAFAPIAIPIAAFWGRCAPLWAIGQFPYLSKNGSAAFHRKYWQKWKEIQPALLLLGISWTILYFAPFTFIKPTTLLFGISLGIVPTFLVPDLLGKKLGGHSGDSYGASLAIVETFMLLILAILWQ